MLTLITSAFIIGFCAAWLAVAFIEMTNYRSILGFIRYEIAKKLEDSEDESARIGILGLDINAQDQAEAMNEDYYKMIAKHSPLMFLLLCKYCFGTWLTILFIIGFYQFFGFEALEHNIIFLIICFSSLYFNLSISNKQTIIIK